MAKLKYYYDLMSQPSRAMYIIFKLSGTPFESCPVALRKGEAWTTEYKNNVNRFQKVPCINDNGFKLSESIAILRYVDSIPSNLYPNEKKHRALVDEYLEWQHNNTRLGCAMYFRKKYLEPILMKSEPKEEEIAMFKSAMEMALDSIETIWLKDNKFLCGDKLTAADIFGACEIEQTRMTGYDPTINRPKLGQWLKTVKEQTNPHYDEAHQFVYKAAARQSKL